MPRQTEFEREVVVRGKYGGRESVPELISCVQSTGKLLEVDRIGTRISSLMSVACSSKGRKYTVREFGRTMYSVVAKKRESYATLQ